VPGPSASLLDGGECRVGDPAIPRRQRPELEQVRMINTVPNQADPTAVNI
jgi:hypothetical protein